MGFLDTIQLFLAFLSIMVLILLIWIIRFEYRWRVLFRSRKGENLEYALREIRQALASASKTQHDIERQHYIIESRVRNSIQGVGVVRFNPFRGTAGSNQSFAIALLDGNRNGFVFSSLYSREHFSVFAKPIKGGDSEYELSEEEMRAIKKAEKHIHSSSVPAS